MPIQVICPGCHKRFNVSDKFAGQKGPCPHCKKEIQIPTKEEAVVVHAPESSGPTDSSGRAVLEPLRRKESKFSSVTAVVAGVVAVVVIAVAAYLRMYDGQPPAWVLAVGSLLIAPPVVWAGYAFLRDDEYEPYVGRALWVRVGICSAVYAALWAAYGFGVQQYVFQGDPMELYHLGIVIPLMVVAGAFAALASLEFEFLNGMMHYGMYLIITVLLRLIMGMSGF